MIIQDTWRCVACTQLMSGQNNHAGLCDHCLYGPMEGAPPMNEVRYFQALLASAPPEHRALIERLRPEASYVHCMEDGCAADAFVWLDRDSFRDPQPYCREHTMGGLELLQEAIDVDGYRGDIRYPIACQQCGRPEVRMQDETIYDGDLVGFGWPCVSCIDGSEDLGPGAGVTARTLCKSLARLLFQRFQGDEVRLPADYRRAVAIIEASLFCTPARALELANIIGLEVVAAA